jgi:hypothetical protein
MIVMMMMMMMIKNTILRDGCDSNDNDCDAAHFFMDSHTHITTITFTFNYSDRPHNDPLLTTAQALTIVSMFFLWTNWITFGIAIAPVVIMVVGKSKCHAEPDSLSNEDC